MRKILIAVQLALLVLALLLALLLMFHRFGQKSGSQETEDGTAAQMSALPTLEQLRTWGDLIVQKNLFSPQRGQAQAAAAEPWAKEGPPFELTAVFGADDRRLGVFVPAGADRAITSGVVLGPGGVLMDKVTVVEIRAASAVIRKPDGLFELKLPEAAAAGSVKLSEQQ